MYKNKNCGAKAVFFVTMAALLVSMMLIPAGKAVVGVNVGDWAKYGNISASWNIPGQAEPPYMAELRNTAWAKLEVTNVLGNTVTVQTSGQYKNGTTIPGETMSGDIETGTGNLMFFIIPANLGPGDTIPVSGIPMVFGTPTINATVTYSRTNRPANQFRYYMSMPAPASGSIDVNFYWDKATGILCELLVSMAVSAPGVSMSMSMQMAIIETNMWTGTIAPPAGGLGDILTQWWFWVIIVVVIVGAVGGVVVVRMRAKKVPVPPPTVPPPPPPPA